VTCILFRELRKLTTSLAVLRTTNNLPCIIVLEKLAADDMMENIKGQLAYMNKFVSVSPEMYQALHEEGIDETVD
jgi:hypothetical protein